MQIWSRGSGGRAIPDDHSLANLVRVSLAERHSRALDRELSTRSFGPPDRAQRTALEQAVVGLRPLLPRRPDAPGAWQGNAEQPISCDGFGSHPCYGTTRRATPSLRSSRLKAKGRLRTLPRNSGPLYIHKLYIHIHTDRVRRVGAEVLKHYRRIPVPRPHCPR